MPPARKIIDFVFVALVIVAISITAIVLAKIVTDAFSMRLDSTLESGQSLVIIDPDMSALENRDPGMTDALQDATQSYVLDTGNPLNNPAFAALYEYAAFALPITWGAVAGTVIWRGKVRSKWSRQGYDYDMFRLVAKMRGSATRRQLLKSLKDGQRNKLQLANELGVDWKTVDNHIEMLLDARLVEEKNVVGTARYYAITESGTRVLSLLATESESRILGDGK